MTGLVGTMEDVTERRETEATLRGSEAALQAMVQHAPLGIVVLDLRGRVQLWNPVCERWFGWSADDIVGTYAPFVPESGRDRFEALLSQVLAGETIEDVEVRPIRRDGTSPVVNLHASPLRTPAGRIIGSIAIMDNVTVQREAEEAARASAERFAALVERSSDLTVVLDGAMQFLYVSPAAADYLGQPAAELLGKRSPPPHTDDVERVGAIVDSLLDEPGGIRHVEYCQHRADGSLRSLSVVMTNLLDTPSVGGIVLNIRDITDRVESEAALREREGLLRALVESASDIISIAEPDGLIRYSSRVSERMLGYAEGSAPGLTVFDIVHPDDVDAVRRLWGERLDDPGFVSPIELRLLKADGTWLDAEVIANNMLDDPAVHGLVLTTRDISERKAAEQALRRSDERFRALVQNLSEAIVVIDRHGKILYNSPSALEMIGQKDAGESADLPWPDLGRVHPDDQGAVAEGLAAALSAPGTVGPIDVRIRHSDGHWVRVEAIAQNLLDDPAVGGVVVTMHDVTVRRRAQDLNARAAAILELVARGVLLDDTLESIARALEESDTDLRCAIYLLDEDTDALCTRAAPSLDESFTQTAGSTKSGHLACLYRTSVHARQPLRVADVENDDRCVDCRTFVLAHGMRAFWSMPLLSTASEEALGALVVYAESTGLPSPAQEQLTGVLAGLAAIAIDRKRFEDRLLHQSLHDPLTGLPNRALFHDRLAHALERSRRSRSEVAVLFLDLDRFKFVNDSLGHDAGDELLLSTAQRLLRAVRPGDTVGRFGGDEFTVLCEDLPPAFACERVAEIAQRLLSAISEPGELRGTEVFLSASIGIAIAPDANARPDDLLRDADAAMYHAKNRGAGHWEVFDQTMRERARTRNETESALHRAIERGELRLFFQPIISILDQRCVGAEALVRWQHPERGLVLPGEFIELAEESGLIHDLGRWVLREAATQATRWQVDAPDGFTVSVNISARQLAQGDLHEIVAETLRTTMAQPHRICLEITESVFMDDMASIVELIGQVRELGVQFSIDDFGTGYSSLAYLKSLPVDAVKVDRSFVSAMTSDTGDAAIVSAVIGLAHALDLRVVAEGVETAEQLAGLAALGCDHAQGFYFSPPQPAPDIRRIFARNRWRVPDNAGDVRWRSLRRPGPPT